MTPGSAETPVWWWDDEATRWAYGVFEGGGAKGAFYGPALSAVRERDIWFRSVAGSSAGALTAAMVAAGATPAQLETWTLDALGQLSLGRPKALRLLFSAARGLREDPPRMVPSAALLFMVEGLLRQQLGRADRSVPEIGRCFPSVPLWQWPGTLRDRIGLLRGELGREIREMRSDGSPAPPRPVTFADLEQATGIELFIVTVDAISKRERVFHHRLTPGESVARAAVSSAAIPAYFPPGDMDAADEDPKSHAILFDGGVWSNFPTWVYKDRSFLAHHEEIGRGGVSRQTGTREDPYVLGFLLDETHDLEGDGPADEEHPPGIFRWLLRRLAIAAFCAFSSPIYLVCLGIFGLTTFLAAGCGSLSADWACSAQETAALDTVSYPVLGLAALAVVYQFLSADVQSGRFLPTHYNYMELWGSGFGLALLVGAHQIAANRGVPSEVPIDPQVVTGIAAGLAVGIAITSLLVLLAALVGPATYGIGLHIAKALTSAGSARYWAGAASDDLVVRVPVAGVKTLDFERAAELLESRRLAVQAAVDADLEEELDALAAERADGVGT